MKIKVAPSILSADFGRLNEDIETVAGEVELLHIDIMDGHFVNNISFGPVVVEWIRTNVPLDVHLMIENPDKYIKDFAKSKPDIITFHSEATDDIGATIRLIKESGCKAGISIKPKTALSEIIGHVKDVDMVLIMTVEPGFGGQSFMMDMLPKIKELRRYIEENDLDVDIQVDGGIKAETAKLAREAGANVLVAGSYIFGAKDRKKAIDSLRGE